MMVLKKDFLVEWVIPTGYTSKDWGVGLRGALPPMSKFYGVAIAKDAKVWVGRAVVGVIIDEGFTPQSSFENVMSSGLTAIWSEIESGDPKLEQRVYQWLATNTIDSFFGDWVNGQPENFKRTRLLNRDLWEEFAIKLGSRELERDTKEEEEI